MYQGKTLAFVLPILESLTNGPAKASRKTGYGRAPSVLVLLPTRELATQVFYLLIVQIAYQLFSRFSTNLIFLQVLLFSYIFSYFMVLCSCYRCLLTLNSMVELLD